MFKKIIEKLRDRTGSSMLLVLAVMLLLLSVGGSALAAGSTAIGQVTAQRDYKQLELYTYSINDSLLSALQKEDRASLGAELAMQFYQNADNSATAPLPTKLTLDITGHTLPSNLVREITLYCFPDVRISPAVPEIKIPNLDAAGNITGYEEIARQPRTALVDATLQVVTSLQLGERTITTAATYRLSDAALVDTGTESSMEFAPVVGTAGKYHLGRWEMIKYEMLASNQYRT